MSDTDRLLARAETMEWPQAVVLGSVISTETGWRRAVELPGTHAALSRQLDEYQERQKKQDASEDRAAEEDARREAQLEPLTPEEQEVVDRDHAEARRRGEYAASTEGKLEKVNETLQEILRAIRSTR